MNKQNDNQISSGSKKIDIAYRQFEWLITAFASTLVFIIFVMQVYRIPTGSMAETLRGAHFRVRCGQCGYKYDHDFIGADYGMSQTANPAKKQVIGPRYIGNKKWDIESPRCPSCGYYESKPILNRGDGKFYVKDGNNFKPAYERTVFKGDQIFVHKCIYQFFEPKRWDVIVFKNPTEPHINYIKRCVGLPKETIQIIDGDIYANNEIQRKPDNVQEELWMPVYLNDYQPSRPAESSFNGHPWKQPFVNIESSKWNLNLDGPTVFGLNSDDATIHTLRYDSSIGNNFKATYGYDNPMIYSRSPVCSDLMVEYYVSMQPQSATGGAVRKYGARYQGWLESDGAMRIVRIDSEGQEILLEEGHCDVEDVERITRFRFATLDHQVILEYGEHKLVHDLGVSIEAAGTGYTVKPEVKIVGQGHLELKHISLYRDIHYFSDDSLDPRYNILRATKNKPVQLGDEEYFACGDNSPASLDSRLWKSEGLGNNEHTYPVGVVPKDYLVGKGMFVHWPGGFRLAQEPIRWIAFPDGMKPIYGGKD